MTRSKHRSKSFLFSRDGRAKLSCQEPKAAKTVSAQICAAERLRSSSGIKPENLCRDVFSVRRVKWPHLNPQAVYSQSQQASDFPRLKQIVPDFPPSVEEIFVDFDDLPDFDDRVDYIIDLGRQLPVSNDELHASENLVSGCMSVVWLRMKTAGADEPVAIEADSDSQIIKGLLVILLAFYRDKTPSQIVESDVGSYLKRLELDQHLSPQRRNGLFSMIKRINGLALAATEA